jgi:hypothetical protein
MNKKVLSIVSFLLLATIMVPAMALAYSISPAPTSSPSNLQTMMGKVADQVWYVFAGIAIVMFLVAGILFLTANGSPEKIGQARQAVIWGIVGIVVGIMAGGIVGLAGKFVS